MGAVDLHTMSLFAPPPNLDLSLLPMHEKLHKLVELLREGHSIEDAAVALGKKKKWAYYWVEQSREGRGLPHLAEVFDSMEVGICDLCNGPIERVDRKSFRVIEPASSLWSRPAFWDEDNEAPISLPEEVRTNITISVTSHC